MSIVICTDNRAGPLKQTLAALRFQTYANFEVCVVAGPTEDGTREMLAAYGDRLKVAACARRNLSTARNIGIAQASGEIVAFLDDDAVPEAEWLEQIADSYANERVGAVGGVVHDRTGIGFQTRFMTVDRLGRAREESQATPELNFPGSLRIPHLLGANSTFRRSALLEIGGFDEQYEYFLDETDVCFRINDNGYKIVQRPDAVVHHKFAASSLRDEKSTIRSWYSIIKNSIYFGLRHAREQLPASAIVEAGLACRDKWRNNAANGVRVGDLSLDDLARFEREAEAAVADGLCAATRERRLITDALLETYRSEFRPFPRPLARGRRQVFVYLNPTEKGSLTQGEDGVAPAARKRASEGHQVHLVVANQGHPYVEFDGDVWLHELGSEGRDGRTFKREILVTAVQRIASRRSIDAAYCLATASKSLQPLVNVLSGQRA